MNTDRLDKHCSKNSPIRMGESHQYKTNCKPMDSDWKDRIQRKWWGLANPKVTDLPDGCDSGMIDLHKGLLAFGGESACLELFEEDLAKILIRGQLWPGKSPVLMKGAQSRCHTNSCLLWEKNQDKLFVATGYALSKDGMWRQHSWCVLPESGTVKIVETTEPRELYFGFVMTLDETLDFAELNTDFGAELKNDTKSRWQQMFPEIPLESRRKVLTF